MPTYIALLRGVNVSGKRILKMKDLVGVLSPPKYRNVRTYVQSGNLIFEHEGADTKKLAVTIERAIAGGFGIAPSVIIRTDHELGKIVRGNPFITDGEVDPERLYVTFLAERPGAGIPPAVEIRKDKHERFALIGSEVYLYCPNGYGRTKMNNSAFEKAFGVIATTRNWRTTTTLLRLSQHRERSGGVAP